MSYLPHLDNLRAGQNRISVAAQPRLLQAAEDEAAFVDKVYGYSWSFTPMAGAGLYGITERFPASPIDALGTRFLRVPFRRVPVIEVDSREMLYGIASRIVSRDDSIKLMWRGQSQGYQLERRKEEASILYGEDSVDEPSLYPSASRSNKDFADVFRDWSAVLDLFLAEHVERLCRSNPEQASEIMREADDLRSGYLFRLWAFATAQHYGLPSVGLDLTDSLDVALMFALHRFSMDSDTGRMSFERADSSAMPVIYALGGFVNDVFDDAELSPEWCQSRRARAQSAHFHGTGWGMSPNKAAERIVIAFSLTNHVDWQLPRSVASLFPSRNVDPLLDFLLDARERFAPIAERAMLDRVYFVD